MYTSLECDTAEYLSSLISGRLDRRRRFHSGESCLRRSSLFSLYARIFRVLLTKWEKTSLDEEADDDEEEEDEYGLELDRLVLPSNEEWRLRVYYRLVELQRQSDCAQALEEDSMSEDPLTTSKRLVRRQTLKDTSARSHDKWDWEPDARTAYPLTPRSSRRLESMDSNVSVILDTCVEPGWRLGDILLAAKLLSNEQQPQSYTDEAEMRRVYGLVYDVLRYEFILDRALNDVGFWLRYRHLKKHEKVVWLLLYDMQGRKFARIGNSQAVALRDQALQKAGILDIEKALLTMRTRLAASLSKLRIGGSALSLDELLPAHLRTAEGVTWGEEGAIASGWVNSAKVPCRNDFVEEMRKLGLQLCSACSASYELGENQYAFDPLCPKVINLHEKAREKLAMSQLVRGHSFVFLERSLCVGAAAMVQAIRAGKLCGPIILTHPLAPRHTGYLAELLADVEDIGRLLVFGLGESRGQHQAYLERLGIPMQRCMLFPEKYTSAPSSGESERATIVLATPPCSYTGVRDVVDLAIARGGDLRLLESLTSLESESPQQPRALLAEQMATLRFALTKPNVQMLVYEVHTLLPSETTEMIQQAVDFANKMALDKYQREHPHRKKTTLKEFGKKSKRKRSMSTERLSPKPHQDDTKSNLESEEETPDIPESDLFEMSNLNDLYGQDCKRLIDPGSFIVVVKRKEMMQFNSLFMIKVAEAKGVFGEPTKPAQPPKRPESTDPALPLRADNPTPSARKSHKKNKIHFERLTAPTYASIIRVLQDGRQPCPRHQQHVVHEESALETQKSPDIEPINDPLPPTPPSPVVANISEPVDNLSPRESDDSIAEEINEETVKSQDYSNSRHADGDPGKSVYELKFKRINNEDLFNDYLKKKGQEGLFNISFKPMRLQLRRQQSQSRAKRLNRIAFQNRLETVYEHSQSFSYLFPEN